MNHRIKCLIISSSSEFIIVSVFAFIFLYCFLLVNNISASEIKKDLLKGERILFLGDSITQDGQYVSFIEYYFNSLFPDKNFDIISIGLSSETVSGLTEKSSPYRRPCLFDRLDFALNEIKPSIVIACYGMNDGIYHPQSKERLEAFESGIMKLISRVQKDKIKLILITPPMFDTLSAKFKPVGENEPDYGFSAPYHLYNTVLGDYASFQMKMSIPNVSVIDLHTAMTDYVLKQRNKISNFSFSGDGIHPGTVGHLFMAQQFMKGIGAEIKNDTLNSELKRIKADSLFIIVNQHRTKRSNGWLSYIGFTLETTVKTNEIDSTEKEAAILQAGIEKLKISRMK
jgi:lysophospholipase L1-like esterase